ncbi:hypothetical protein KKA02_02770 [Patescibacteria group bacterium]|nr:hypothetical protein [Patescibacteria group bacterium]
MARKVGIINPYQGGVERKLPDDWRTQMLVNRLGYKRAPRKWDWSNGFVVKSAEAMEAREK